jgi:hypothetical protein
MIPLMRRQLNILQRNVEETVAVLGVNQPIEGASADESEKWLEWWRPIA